MRNQLIRWKEAHTMVLVRELWNYGTPTAVLQGIIKDCDDFGFSLEVKYPNGFSDIFCFPYSSVAVSTRVKTR